MDDEINQIIIDQVQSLKEQINSRNRAFQQYIDNRNEFGLSFNQMINQLLDDLPESFKSNKQLKDFQDMYSNQISVGFPVFQRDNEVDKAFWINTQKKQMQAEKEQQIQLLEQSQEKKMESTNKKLSEFNPYQQDKHLDKQQFQSQQNMGCQNKRQLRVRPLKQQNNPIHTVKRTSYYKKKLKKLVKCQFCNKRFLHYYGLVRHEQNKHNITRHMVDQQQVKIEN